MKIDLFFFGGFRNHDLCLGLSPVRSFSRSSSSVSWLLVLASGTSGVELGIDGAKCDEEEIRRGLPLGPASSWKPSRVSRARRSGSPEIVTCPMAAMFDVLAVALDISPCAEPRPKLASLGR